MAWVPAVISGIGALGGLFGNRGKTQTSSGTQQNNSSMYTMPALTAEQGGVLYPTADTFLANLNKDPDLSGYKAGQQQDINNLADVRQRALKMQMAQRGIDPNSPAGMTYFNNSENQRYSDTTKLNNSIPLLAQQILQSKIAQGIDLFSKLPGGSWSQGSTNIAQQGNVSNPGDLLGGLFGSLGTILASLYGQGAFGGGDSSSNTSKGGNV